MVGCPMLVLQKKLQRLKSSLKTWNKNVFGNVNKMVLEKQIDLDQIQCQLESS